MVKLPGPADLRPGCGDRGLGRRHRVCYQTGMKPGIRSGLVGATLALLIAVALAIAGWAHRGPAPSDRNAQPELAAFLATGGSVEDLCGLGTGNGPHRDHCPVCTLPGALPPPVSVKVAQPLARTGDPGVIAAALLPRAACHPGWNGRAPPVV